MENENEMKEFLQEEAIKVETFRKMFEGKKVRLGLVRDPGAIMEQWASLGSVAEIIAWNQKWDIEVGTLESVVRDLVDVLGPNGPLICVFSEEEGTDSVLVNPHDGKIYPNWE